MESVKKRKSRLAVFEHLPHKLKEKREEKPYHRMRHVEKRYGTKRSRTPSDSELVIDDDEDNPLIQPKKKLQAIPLKLEQLNLQCDWMNCSQIFTNYREFVKHVTSHSLEELLRKDSFECFWIGCSYIAINERALLQHLYFHGYHTKLKNIGTNVTNRNKLPKCNQQTEFVIPDVSCGFICMWEFCDNLYFDNIFDFFEHSYVHVANNPKICKEGEIIYCKWKGCTAKFITQYKLGDHIRTHTKEKVIACPTCSNLFASKTKFHDHRKRQMSVEMQSYQCSQCQKFFASERLLRDHMSVHINHYKCHMCDMTCTKPSTLAVHIRYRHLPDRPFKCTVCEHTSVTKQDLENHIFTHYKGNLISCESCDYRCRSKRALEKHMQMEHEDEFTSIYACHCCDKRFFTGNGLTKHLINVHEFQWPSGHSRFRYKADPEDGLYRLQTVRYESLEVTQEMINNTQQEPSDASQVYTLQKIKDGTDRSVASFCIVSVTSDQSISTKQTHKVNQTPTTDLAITKHEKNSQESTESVNFEGIVKLEDQLNKNGIQGTSKLIKTDNNIYITIEEVDEKGNIVSTETIESNEIVFAKAEGDNLLSTIKTEETKVSDN